MDQNESNEPIQRIRESKYSMNSSSVAQRSPSGSIHPLTRTRVISFTSGKGGVGKSQLVLNTALALAQNGKSVLLLDGDIGLANINVLLGIQPKRTLADFVLGHLEFEEIIARGPFGIDIIPGVSGQQGLNSLTFEHRYRLLDGVERIGHRYDYLLIDTQAGVGPEVLYFNSASGEVVCVITPEPTSLTDAYALIKLLARSCGEKRISILVNSAGDVAQAKTAFSRLSTAVERFLHVKVELLGVIPEDSAVREAVSSQRALLEVFPSSKAAMALQGCVERLDRDFRKYSLKGGMQFFFQRILEEERYGC